MFSCALEGQAHGGAPSFYQPCRLPSQGGPATSLCSLLVPFITGHVSRQEWVSLVAQWMRGRRHSIPGLRRSLEKEMAVHSSILAWEIHGQRTLAGYSPWGLKESDMTERLKHTDTHRHTHTHTDTHTHTCPCSSGRADPGL